MRNDLEKSEGDMKVGASRNDQKLIKGLAEKGYNSEEISHKLRIKHKVVSNFMPEVPEFEIDGEAAPLELKGMDEAEVVIKPNPETLLKIAEKTGDKNPKVTPGKETEMPSHYDKPKKKKAKSKSKPKGK